MAFVVVVNPYQSVSTDEKVTWQDKGGINRDV